MGTSYSTDRLSEALLGFGSWKTPSTITMYSGDISNKITASCRKQLGLLAACAPGSENLLSSFASFFILFLFHKSASGIRKKKRLAFFIRYSVRCAVWLWAPRLFLLLHGWDEYCYYGQHIWPNGVVMQWSQVHSYTPNPKQTCQCSVSTRTAVLCQKCLM